MAEELIEEQNSQSSELGEEDLNKLEELSVPKNTKSQTLCKFMGIEKIHSVLFKETN